MYKWVSEYTFIKYGRRQIYNEDLFMCSTSLVRFGKGCVCVLKAE